MPVVWDSAPFGFLVLAMGFEVGIVQSLRTLQDNEAAVIGTIGSEVDNSLDTLQAEQMRRLVDMWPWSRRLALTFWKRQGIIDAVKRGKKFVGAPYFLECGQHAWFTETNSACVRCKVKRPTHILAFQTNFSWGTA